MTDHERIWLEPSPGEDIRRTWCSDNVWGDEGTEYVRADLAGSPTPVSSSAGLEEACVAVRLYVESKEWGGGKYTVHDGSWNERVEDCLADIRAHLASEGGK